MSEYARRRLVLEHDAHLISQVTPRRDFADGSQACLEDPFVFDLPLYADEYETEAARRVCRRCPLRVECLAWAVDVDEPSGVWGGRTQLDRRRIARIIRRSKKKESAP